MIRHYREFSRPEQSGRFASNAWAIMHLTNKLAKPDVVAVESRDSASAGAPANEDEITEEMVARGIDALQQFNLSEDRLDWIVITVYEEMVKAAFRPLANGRNVEAELPDPQAFPH